MDAPMLTDENTDAPVLAGTGTDVPMVADVRTDAFDAFCSYVVMNTRAWSLAPGITLAHVSALARVDSRTYMHMRALLARWGVPPRVWLNRDSVLHTIWSAWLTRPYVYVHGVGTAAHTRLTRLKYVRGDEWFSPRQDGHRATITYVLVFTADSGMVSLHVSGDGVVQARPRECVSAHGSWCAEFRTLPSTPLFPYYVRVLGGAVTRIYARERILACNSTCTHAHGEISLWRHMRERLVMARQRQSGRWMAPLRTCSVPVRIMERYWLVRDRQRFIEDVLGRAETSRSHVSAVGHAAAIAAEYTAHASGCYACQQYARECVFATHSGVTKL